MSVLTNISLSGLTTTNADYVITQNLEVNNSLVVNSGATVTLPNNSIADTALSTNVAFLNTANTFTNNNNFTTNTIDDVNLQINYSNVSNIAFCPQTSAGSLNPYCVAGDCFMGGDPGGSLGFVIGRRNRYNAIRFTDTSLNLFADVEMNLLSGGINCMSLYMTDASFNVRCNFYEPIISNYVSASIYENQFLGRIWTEKTLSSALGLYIQNNISPTPTTYASINNLGQAILANLRMTATARDTALLTIDNTINTSYIDFYPVCNNDFSNPLVNNNDSLILADGPAGSGLTICRKTTNGTGTRYDVSTIKNQASGSIQFWITGAPSASFSQFDSTGKLVLQDGFEVNGTSLLSNALDVGGRSNEFVNDVYCGSTIKTVGGVFVETALGVAVASINSAGLVSAPNANITTITTTTQANADNSTKCATTAFVKNQGYAVLSATQTFTGLNTFNTTALNAQPFKVNSTGLQANNPFVFISPCLTTTAYNPITVAGDSLISLSDTSNSPTTSLCLAVHSGAYSGIRLGPINTNIYSKETLSQFIWDSTVSGKRVFEYTATANISYTNLDCRNNILPPSGNVATTSKHMGFQTSPTITTPTGNTAQQIASAVFDNGANLSYGTYQFEYHLTINTTASAEIKSALNTTAASMGGDFRDSQYSPSVSFDSNLNCSAVIRIYSTQTWRLNIHIVSGAYTYVNGLFRITRIA